MSRRIAIVVGAVLLIALVGVGLRCGADPDVGTLPVQHRWDVIGTVTRVDFDKDYRREPARFVMAPTPEVGNGGRTVAFRVGPAVLHLADGRQLRVPAHTPGANACVELLRPADKLALTGLPAPDGLSTKEVRRYGARNLTCVVVAALDRSGFVTRFSVLDTSSSLVGPRGLAEVGAILVKRGERWLTQSGYAFPLAPDVKGDCTPDRGTRGRFTSALVDARHGVIVEVNCIATA